MAKDRKEENKDMGEMFADFLAEDIVNGMVDSGEKLPPAGYLAKKYHVSVLWVRRAVNNLIKQGYLTRIPKKGIVASVPEAQKERKHIIGVISLGGASTEPKLFEAMGKEIAANDLEMQIRITGNSSSKEEKLLKAFIDSGVAGVIIEPSKSQMLCRHKQLFDKMEKRHIPVVFIRSVYPQMSDFSSIRIDDSRGCYLLTRHLIAVGKRTIIGIFKADDSRGIARHKGYVEALQEAGIAYRPEKVIWYHSEEKNKKARIDLEEILHSESGCDGIICYDDPMAKTILYFLLSKGYRVPEDVAVAGYGNLKAEESTELGLTTVDEPDELLGELAAKSVIERIKKTSVEKAYKKMLDPAIIIRESTIGTTVHAGDRFKDQI